ncbi:Glutaredoxin-1 [Marinomonas spartinae]|uniref:glutaredoxin domain-containing protein n=1 Tax=Marinomonas spartinae TaxID=1792290 RepID=UPI000808F18A|nr:glutaredoxin domain-containing protein [Marinomonas spartinae]SBS32987.1 Glutaredoxin-1 [Marinomonas spartinae]
MKKYLLYGHDDCLFSRRAKQVLDNHDVLYHYVDIKGENLNKVALSRLVGHDIYTLPQVFLDDEYIGGFHDLQRRFSIM